MRAWHTFHRRSVVTACREEGGSGKASKGCPMRKWPGVRTSMPSPSLGVETRGLELRHASIWVRIVANSSNVSFASPTTLLRCIFTLFTADSQSPPKCGAHSGMKFQRIPWDAQKFGTSPVDICPLRNSAISANSLDAP